MACIRVLFVLLSILVGPIACRSKRQTGCRTPNGETSSCIAVINCKPIVDFVKQTEVTNEVISLLSKYACNSDNSGAKKVCCPTSLANLNTANDFSTHRNVNLLPLDTCGMPLPNDRITNGNITGLFENPWAAALKFSGVSGTSPYVCGGSLINNRYVLTAAHCIRGPYKIVGVRLGEHDFRTEMDCENINGEKRCAPLPQDFDISDRDVLVHPEYNSVGQVNDIALIRLPRMANINDESVIPVCLPISKIHQKHNEDYTVIGWGKTEEGIASPILLKVQVPQVEQTKCAQRYSGQIDLTDKQLCAGGRNEQDSCRGDSGGPLTGEYSDGVTIKTIQYGIVSIGPGYVCGRVDFPVVYTKVTKYVQWILDNISA